ncbi:unnamed protein product [Thlaspi arvense]|uniref:Uncharacterized protein n=1 Tax=Thlaspi arvense TaxID=13288 RepID=A0AAU9SRP8_THLAR|nr:unnamed protein product [Thlaspi arvense]
MGQFPDEPGVLGGVAGVGLGLGTDGVGTDGVGTCMGGLGLGTGLGLGLGLGFGLGLGLQPQFVAAVKVKKRMLSAKKRAREAEFFEAIVFLKR